MTKTLTALTGALLASVALPATAQDWRATETGVVVEPASGAEAAVRIEVYGERVLRVTSVPEGADLDLPPSLMVNAAPRTSGFVVRQAGDTVEVATGQMRAEVALADGRVQVFDAAGNAVLTEDDGPVFGTYEEEGRRYISVSQRFNPGTDEGFYGLGQHQFGHMNHNGKDVELAQHNMDIAIPFVVSTKNYGVLWDNNSITRFGDPRPEEFAGRSIRVTGEGGAPGFTARYYLGDELRVTQQEEVIDYQFIEDQDKWPAAARADTVMTPESGQNTAGQNVQTQYVNWDGTLHPETTGTHKFRLYSSSYVTVYADGEQVLHRWRQNWNPWYHEFDIDMTAGEPVDLKIEWEPNAGYIALFHRDPLPEAERHSLTFTSEAGHGLDYYVVTGDDMDGVISSYRGLTGKAPMMPKWAYGFWQSRQRYATQDELVGVLEEYRARDLPIDNMVQDWFYWREDDWGSHEFDPARFPDPQAMVDRVHELDARIMISVWPKFYPTTDHYKELDRIGAMYTRNVEAQERDWVGPGYFSSFYDPYNAEGRQLYWEQMRDTLAAKGFDAWWMDAVEPDLHSNLSIEKRKYRMGPTALGPGGAFFNSYPLVHADGLYTNLVEHQPDVRPFILTRSGFGGIQRTASALWSGDVVARWDDLKDQISAGVNTGLSGVPNWTHDIGGFALEQRYTDQDPEHIAEWRELNVRWFQFGAFSPLFRSHGEAPKREIFELGADHRPTYEALAEYDRLRYRLLPYIYTIAADTHHRDGTMMRGLVMDFPADRAAWDVNDQYLFGPAFLVAPVTQFGARERQVYLPAGTDWYDWQDGSRLAGGQRIVADAPYDEMPLFVRAGSIVPTGPVRQHVGDLPDAPVTLLVYPGADGTFSLYEDDGTSRQYLNGAWARIGFDWDDATGTLTIGPREGRFDGMQERRTFHIRWMGEGRGFDPEAPADESVEYTGGTVTISR